MVKRHFVSKIGTFFKKVPFLAIILLVIANLVLADFALAKKVEISSKEVTRIKNSIDTVQLFTGIFVSDEKIRTALNMFFRGGEAGADITYGLVVLSATNEMELIDTVISFTEYPILSKLSTGWGLRFGFVFL